LKNVFIYLYLIVCSNSLNLGEQKKKIN